LSLELFFEAVGSDSEDFVYLVLDELPYFSDPSRITLSVDSILNDWVVSFLIGSGMVREALNMRRFCFVCLSRVPCMVRGGIS
jgi:hypothetical protein